jgi:hypothetical protein
MNYKNKGASNNQQCYSELVLESPVTMEIAGQARNDAGGINDIIRSALHFQFSILNSQFSILNYLCTRPEPSPFSKFSTSLTLIKLKSP